MNIIIYRESIILKTFNFSCFLVFFVTLPIAIEFISLQATCYTLLHLLHLQFRIILNNFVLMLYLIASHGTTSHHTTPSATMLHHTVY